MSLRLPSSHRAIALHRDAVARTGVRPIVPHRTMLRTTIVPERDGVFLPAKPALEQRAFRMLVEVFEDSRAFITRHADQTFGESAIYIKRLLPGHRMRAHHRMF